MAKSLEKLEARRLRKDGVAIGIIARKLKVSKSSVSLWCRDIVLTKEQVEKMMVKANQGSTVGRMKAWEWHRNEKRIRHQSNFWKVYKKIDGISRNQLFLIGIALYWSEGSKRDGRVMLVNSDPDMLLLFKFWLSECYQISKDRLVCRVAINIEHLGRMHEIENYWSEILGIPSEQFTKTTIIKSKWKKKYEDRDKYHGIMSLSVRKSTNLSYEIEGSINNLREIRRLMIQ